MCSYCIVGNKIFCSFKKVLFAFLDEGTFQVGRGSEILQNFEGVAHKVGGLTDLKKIYFFFGGGGGGYEKRV